MKNYVQYKIKSLRKEKITDSISHKTKIYDLSFDNNVLIFKISPTERRKLDKFLKEKNIEILDIQKKGFLFSVLNILKSWGFVLGCIFGLSFIFFQSLFIKQVEVWGEVKNEECIINFIESMVVNKLKNNVDTKDLEVKIYDQFDDVSFVSVSIIGQTLIVNIKEKEQPEEMSDSFSPLIADVNGQITSINLIQGTLCVKVGDIVKVGDVLVLPYLIDSQGNQKNILPQAEIYADVWLTSSFNHQSSYVTSVRTGKKMVKKEVLLKDLVIYNNNVNNFFQKFDIEIVNKPVITNNLLPFVLRETIYYEVEEKLIKENFEDMKEEIISQCKQKNLQKIEDCEIIKKEDTIIREVGDITTVINTITVNRKIGG